MSDYQNVTVKRVEGETIVVQVVECHPDMTELRRIVDRSGQVRKSFARRARHFAALLLTEYNSQNNSFIEQMQFLVELGVVSGLAEAAQKILAGVEIADLVEIGAGTDGPMHKATVTITARSPLVFRSFRKGKGHGAVATLDGDIEVY